MELVKCLSCGSTDGKHPSYCHVDLGDRDRQPGLSWDELRPYERQQGGYWLYPPGCDVYGNAKTWVPVPRPT